MAAILDGHVCPSCSQRHDLCSPDTNRLEVGVVYEYECPECGDPVELITDQWNLIDLVSPPGKVPLRRLRELTIHDTAF